MTISGDWRIAEQAKYAPQGHYGFTFIPVPKAGDTPSTWAGGWSMALIPDSKVAAQATKFIQYIAGPDGQKVYTKESTHLPTLNALLTDSVAVRPSARTVPRLAADRQEPPAAGRRCRLLGCPDDRHGFRRAQLEAADGCPQGC